jgi:hypothetical protein
MSWTKIRRESGYWIRWVRVSPPLLYPRVGVFKGDLMSWSSSSASIEPGPHLPSDVNFSPPTSDSVEPGAQDGAWNPMDYLLSSESGDVDMEDGENEEGDGMLFLCECSFAVQFAEDKESAYLFAFLYLSRSFDFSIENAR